MAKEWYYQRGGEVYGPFDPEQLRGKAAGGEVKPHTLIRRGEAGQWVVASQVKGLLPEGPVETPVELAAPASETPEVRRACWYCGTHRPVSTPFCGACGASWESARAPQIVIQQQVAARRVDGRAIMGLVFLTIAGIFIFLKANNDRSLMLALGGVALTTTALIALCTLGGRRTEAKQSDNVSNHVRKGFGYLGYIAMHVAMFVAVVTAIMGAIAVAAVAALIAICTGGM